MWLSDIIAGAFTDTKPDFPSYQISIGGSKDSQVSGCIWANITTTTNDIYNRGWDGAVKESFDFYAKIGRAHV